MCKEFKITRFLSIWGVWFTRIGRSQDAKKHGEIKSNHKKMYGYNSIMLLSHSLMLHE